MMYLVYIIRCQDGSLYTGITNDLEKRFAKHKAGLGERYTRSHKVKEIVYTENLKTKSRALKREAEIKRLNKGTKLKLIA